jgi:hypothetical protein
MRIMRIVNVIPADHSNETNTDSEPNITVNPQNPREIIITTFTPPDAGNPNGPLFFTLDGGENWSLRFDVPGGMPDDQTVCFATSSNELYMTTLHGGSLNLLRSADPSTGATFPILETRSNIDQPWIEAITVEGGPDNGKDRVYIGYNDLGHTPQSATIDVCLDALTSTPTFNQVRLETRVAGVGQDGYSIRPVAHRDGTVYVAYQGWRSVDTSSNITMDMVVVRDDNWGSGSNTFTSLTDPSDGRAGRKVASGVIINNNGSLDGERLNNDFNIAVDPNNSNIIYIVWCDNNGPNYTLRVRRSINRGVDWSGDLITVDNATLACLAINNSGSVGLFYLQLISSKWEAHFRTAKDGNSWDDTLLARTSTVGFFIGDYTRLVAVGNNFYGVFPAMNTPDPSNFFPNGGGTFHFQRNFRGTTLLGADNTTVISPSVDPFFFKVEEKDVTFLIERSTFGQEEIDARQMQPRDTLGGLPIADAFRVVIDGFTATELGITGPNSTLNVPSPRRGIIINCTGNHSDSGSYGTEIQRFTFHYNVDFTDDSVFNFVGDTDLITLNVTVGGISTSGQIELVKQPDPFILHGDPPWLSIDLRLFVVRAGETKFGVTMGADASAAPQFIQQVMTNLTTDGSIAYGEPFNNLPTDESAKLFVYPNDNNGQRVFNFALAKVRSIGLIGASNVRVFFRLFQALTTTGAFDYPPGGQYRRIPSIAVGSGNGQPIPLPGIQGNEFVTIPCFASQRIDAATQSMDQQSDEPNRQNFLASSSGSEIDLYYGCWLDFNQPFKPDNVTQIMFFQFRSLHQMLTALSPIPIIHLYRSSRS